jgi:MFS family permease
VFTARKADRIMDWRNRIGLYGSYFFGVAGIGFTLPYLPLYLRREGFSVQAISLISTFAALAGLAQFPVGIWSDRLRARKPFLIAALGVLTLATGLLYGTHHTLGLALLVVLFAENGICRAVVESLTGAEATVLARQGEVGAALGALRVWKPIGIVAVALAGSWLAERNGVGSILIPLTVVQGLGFLAAFLIHEERKTPNPSPPPLRTVKLNRASLSNDPALWAFVAAMLLFHAANAPGGVFLGLFLDRDLHAPERLLAYAFVVSMISWTIVVWPAGWLADRSGRRPLLIAAWGMMALRMALVAVAQSPWQVIANQALDGASNAMFAVLAVAWVSDRLADSRRAGEAQVIVGSCLVLGSALGPAVCGLLVGALGYRGLFAALAGVGVVATAIVVFLVPETLVGRGDLREHEAVDLRASSSDLSIVS